MPTSHTVFGNQHNLQYRRGRISTLYHLNPFFGSEHLSPLTREVRKEGSKASNDCKTQIVATYAHAHRRKGVTTRLKKLENENRRRVLDVQLSGYGRNVATLLSFFSTRVSITFLSLHGRRGKEMVLL